MGSSGRQAAKLFAPLRTLFRVQNKFRRQAYLLAVLIAIPIIASVWLSRFDIAVWRSLYGGLLISLLLAGGGLLISNLPLRWIERFVLGIIFTFGLGKYVYLVYEPSARELINWLEIQAIFWTFAIGFIVAYQVFDRKTALWLCLTQVVLILLVTLPLFDDFSGEILREFFRLEVRLVAIAFLVLILAKAKDDLRETQDRALDVEMLAYLDPLTGLANRRSISQLIEQRLAQPNPELALVVADIDFFKSINDAHGHDTGDNVLREVASLLKGSLRERDVVGRWGGEEFIILLHQGKALNHIQTIERLHRMFENKTLSSGLRITLSFGGADWRKGDTLEKLFARADQALYVAKSKGRNRVEWSF